MRSPGEARGAEGRPPAAGGREGRGGGPLAGRRIVVTRPPDQAGELVTALRALGAEPVPRPAIEILPLADASALDAALRRLNAYAWVVFTSANGVRAVWRRFAAIGAGLEEVLEHGEEGGRGAGPRVAAIGPATAAALERRLVRPDFVPGEYVAEALARGLPDVEGRSVLLLRTDVARAALREILQARGARVEDVPAYRTLSAGRAAGRTSDAVAADAVTFTSPSTVRGYLAREGGLPRGAAVVCIGPVTAGAAKELGIRVDAVAERYTVGGLVEALVRHFATADAAAPTPCGSRRHGPSFREGEVTR